MTAVAVAGGEGKRRAAGNGDAALGLIMVAPILVTMVALVFFPLGQTVWDSLHRINPMQAGTPVHRPRQLHQDAFRRRPRHGMDQYLHLCRHRRGGGDRVRRARGSPDQSRSDRATVAAGRGRPAMGAAWRRQRRDLDVDLPAGRRPAERNPHGFRPALRQPRLVQRSHERHRRRGDRPYLAHDAADRRHRARGHAEHPRSSLRSRPNRRRDATADVPADHAAADSRCASPSP